MRRRRDPETLDEGSGGASSARDLNLHTTKRLQMISGKAERRAEREGNAADSERLRSGGRGEVGISFPEVIGRRGSCGLRGIWRRLETGGGGAGGVNAALPRDGSLPALFRGNFPNFSFFFVPGKQKLTQETQRCGRPCAGILRGARLSTLTHYIVVGSSSHRSCEEHRREFKKNDRALMSLQNREGLLWKTRASTCPVST